MKLNGWQRIGVVVSVLWAIGAGIAEWRSIVDHSYDYFSKSSVWCGMEASSAKNTAEILSRDIVAALEAEKNAFSNCTRRALETSAEMREFNGKAALSILAVSFLPIVFGWLLAFFGIKIFRWVRAGFSTEPNGPVAGRTTVISAPLAPETSIEGKNDPVVVAPKAETQIVPSKHTPLWLALIAFAIGVVFVANRLIAKTAGVSPLAFLGDLPNVLPVLARHPDATVNYLAEATGMAVLVPLVHTGIASLFPSKRNKTSRRRIFIGWSVVGAIAATFL